MSVIRNLLLGQALTGGIVLSPKVLSFGSDRETKTLRVDTDDSWTLTVEEAAPPAIGIVPSSLEFPALGGEVTATVRSDSEWIINT